MVNYGYKGVQIFVWDDCLIDLEKVVESKIYCDELKGKVVEFGLEIIELVMYL